MKLQMKVQKIICLIALFAGALAFIFALGLSTTVYQLHQTEALISAEPEGFYEAVQAFNHKLILYCIVLILCAVTLFITGTNSRRNYYISNYVSTALCVIAGLVIAFITIANVSGFINIFKNEVDFETWATDTQIMDAIRYTESTFWFDINIVTMVLVIIADVLLVLNLVWKIMLMKNEDKLLKESQAKPESQEVVENVEANL